MSEVIRDRTEPVLSQWFQTRVHPLSHRGRLSMSGDILVSSWLRGGGWFLYWYLVGKGHWFWLNILGHTEQIPPSRVSLFSLKCHFCQTNTQLVALVYSKYFLQNCTFMFIFLPFGHAFKVPSFMKEDESCFYSFYSKEIEVLQKPSLLVSVALLLQQESCLQK